MIPWVMSIEIEIAVPCEPPAIARRRMPGVTYAMYASRPPVAPPSPSPSVEPKTNTKSR